MKEKHTNGKGAGKSRAFTRGRESPTATPDLAKEIKKSGKKKAGRALDSIRAADIVIGREEPRNPEGRAVRTSARSIEDGTHIVARKGASAVGFSIKSAKKLHAKRKSQKSQREEKARIREETETIQGADSQNGNTDPVRSKRSGKGILSKGIKTLRGIKRGTSATVRAASAVKREMHASDSGESTSGYAAEKYERFNRDMIVRTGKASAKTGHFALKNVKSLHAKRAARMKDDIAKNGEQEPQQNAASQQEGARQYVRDRQIKTRESQQKVYRNTLTRDKAVYRAQAGEVMAQKSDKSTTEKAVSSVQRSFAESKKAQALAEKQNRALGGIRTGRAGSKDIMPKTASKRIGKQANTIRQGQRQIKTAQHYAHTTRQTVKKAKKAREVMRYTAMKTAKTAKVAIKKAAEAAKLLLRMLIKAGQMVLAALAAVGPFLLLIVVLLSLVVAVISSPFGIFFSPNDNNNPHISQIVRDIEAECDAKLAEMTAGFDPQDVAYDWESDGAMGGRWLEIVPVFAVKTTTDADNGMDVATLDANRQRILREIFWDMVTLNSFTRSVPVESEVQQEDGSVVMETTYKTELVVTMETRSALEQAEQYGFDEKQMNMLHEALTPEYQTMLMQLLGIDAVMGLTPEEMMHLYNNLPVGEIGAEIVKFALSRLGDKYSTRDCSKFTGWVYETVAGINLPRRAADQGKWCVEKGVSISFNDLQPGDLIFWWANRSKRNGRYMNIDHVGIYAGNGYVVDSSFSRGRVVYRKLYDEHVMYGRAYLAN